MGSLAGAAHLLNCNADALSLTHGGQKLPVDRKGKSWTDILEQCPRVERKLGLEILYTRKVFG